jgi:hypothetical protein
MSRPLASCAVVAVCCLAGPLCAATDTPAAAIPSLSLHDGRVLHNATFVEDEGDSIVIRSVEGLTKVAKMDLPDGVLPAVPKSKPQDASLVVRTFDPDKPPTSEEPEAKPPPKPVSKAEPSPSGVSQSPAPTYKGCSIISFEKKPFQNILGCAEIVIQNASDASVELHPRDFACLLSGGGRRVGRNIVAIQFLPPAIRRREIVGPGASDDIIVTFDNGDLDIAAVQWAH